MTAFAEGPVVKAHAYGNDFLLVEGRPPAEAAALARRLCDRHRGVGADGVIFFRRTAAGASMDLLNADGSYSEVSGNGVRCLGALLARHSPERLHFVIETDAGPKTLDVLGLRASPARTYFRAAMGQPEDVARVELAGREVCTVTTLRVGNPQCVMLVSAAELTEANLQRFGPFLTAHPHFQAGTNVELAHVESPGRVRILIWERGVGPTEASGTGACAAAVAAAAHGGAAREVDVVSPGGTQRVEWRDDGLYLTGWAELVCEVQWLAG
ncbi:MAG TPA: diaminopimelate epimerase [Vicinamibacterales bacterium]|nr:diaminopimelate epimerase [Vicinamibacterales bacterium]